MRSAESDIQVIAYTSWNSGYLVFTLSKALRPPVEGSKSCAEILVFECWVHIENMSPCEMQTICSLEPMLQEIGVQ